MSRYLINRILLSIPTLFCAGAVIFLLVRMVPGDPVMLIIEENFTQSSYEAVQRQLGLDRPAWIQFVDALKKALRGDLGYSFHNQRPVLSNIADQLPHTIHLAAAALLVSAVAGIPAGIIAAVHRNRWLDRFIMVTALMALCAPSFWLAVILILIFSLHLGWFPSFGVGPANDWLGTVSHLVLPALVLGLNGAGILARMTRSALVNILGEEFIKTSRAMGFGERVIYYRYALRNALIPVITVLGLEAITLLTGTVVVETVFARRGIGVSLVEAILTRDYPQIQGILMLFVTLVLIVNLVVDLLYGVADPRVRYE